MTWPDGTVTTADNGGGCYGWDVPEDALFNGQQIITVEDITVLLIRHAVWCSSGTTLWTTRTTIETICVEVNWSSST